MVKASHGFQVFVKPTGSICNLGCQYCYYLEKDQLYPEDESFQMPENVLDNYIKQHIEACPDDTISFSWHGGEPTLLGLDFFRRIVELEKKYKPRDKTILNGVQTNGTLLDDELCRFFAKEGFAVGISIDGPKELHDRFRVTKDHRPTFEQVMRGYQLLQKHEVYTDVLCVVNSVNVQHPLEVYRFFKGINAKYITFLPCVDPQPEGGVSDLSVPSEAWGRFLCTVFDEWVREDIGRVKVQIFEEAVRTAFNQEHSLCIFRPTCGDIPVLEHNGDLYSCDHYVAPEHLLGNIKQTPLVELLESPAQEKFGENKQTSLPRICRECRVLAMCNGECPKNRFTDTPDGEHGLNYLCTGYKLFFTHIQPFTSAVAAQWRKERD
ncbi:anaerobic sulfatase maturase [Candidatus Bathyarchaeota archaeon]|nr:anaerobic sulfatase maturase [Candidatus Bathyarchaeota archaeon]